MRRIIESSAPLLLLALCSFGMAARAAPPEKPAVSTAVGCDDQRAKAVAAMVQRRYDTITHLSADFEQTTRSVVLGPGPLSGDGAGDSVARGTVIFAKLGRMRWSYREPEESYVISDGDVLWIYDVGARQATRLPVTKDYLAGAALQFLLGEGQIIGSFDVAVRSCSDRSVELELRPREPTSYERLGLTADPETGLIIDTSIVDLFGNRTRISFQNVTVNHPLDEEAFEFVPPKGVEVMDLGSGQ